MLSIFRVKGPKDFLVSPELGNIEDDLTFEYHLILKNDMKIFSATFMSCCCSRWYLDLLHIIAVI